MSRRKHPSTGERGLDKTKVAPGLHTGVYYITMTGLQKDTKWSTVKDFLRDGNINGSVDHIQMHTGTTTGWVRVFGYRGFKAAMYCFHSASCEGTWITVDGSQERKPTEITNLDTTPPNRLPPSWGRSGAFEGQIPPLPTMSEGGSSQTKPTQYNHSDAAQTEQFYDVLSDTLVADMDSLAVADDTPLEVFLDYTPAHFKIMVQRDEGVIDKDMVRQFVESVAPGAMLYVVRIDLLDKRHGPAKRAMITFIDAGWCDYARSNFIGRVQDHIRMVEQAADDGDPEEEAAAAAGPSVAAPGTGEQPKPTGPRLDPRSRSEKRHDHRMEMPQHKRSKNRGRGVAAGGEPSSSGGPGGSASGKGKAKDTEQRPLVVDGTTPSQRHHGRGTGGGSSSGTAAPGAPGGSSASGGAQPAAKDTPQRPLVVDGTTPPKQRHHKRKHG